MGRVVQGILTHRTQGWRRLTAYGSHRRYRTTIHESSSVILLNSDAGVREVGELGRGGRARVCKWACVVAAIFQARPVATKPLL